MRRLLASILFCFALLPALAQSSEQLTHTVQPGENLYRIALRYGVDINELAQVNQITDVSRIFRGQVLAIPGLSVPDDSNEVVNPLVAGTPAKHVVQPGESLTMIANLYGMTVEQLIRANNIASPNFIHRGQELNVWTAETVQQNAVAPDSLPDALTAGPQPESATTYTVQYGEHLSQIARRFGITWTALAQANGIVDPNHIQPGQVLSIPGTDSTVASPQPQPQPQAAVVADRGIIQPPEIVAPAATIAQGKQIIVDLSDSRIYAYENGQVVHSVLASTGLPATPTVQGDFTVQRRVRAQTMSGPGYYLPNVEWVLYFYAGYAIHGTYWHSNYGQPMSHGCVNLPNHEAQWFFDWAPIGTPVRVQA